MTARVVKPLGDWDSGGDEHLRAKWRRSYARKYADPVRRAQILARNAAWRAARRERLG
jgi:hypothetical protein